MKDSPEHPGVVFPPPILYVLGFALGLFVDSVWPFDLLSQNLKIEGNLLGFLLLAAGLSIMFAGLATFFYFRTAVYPNRSASSLVTSGPYGYSRNPMYLGLSVAYIGGSLLCHTLWPVLFLPLVITLVTVLVIQREERYLSAAFGSEYAEYADRVRRWI